MRSPWLAQLKESTTNRETIARSMLTRRPEQRRWAPFQSLGGLAAPVYGAQPQRWNPLGDLGLAESALGRLGHLGVTGAKAPIVDDLGFNDPGWPMDWFKCPTGADCGAQRWIKWYNGWPANSGNKQSYDPPSQGVLDQATANYVMLKKNVKADAPGAEQALADWTTQLNNQIDATEAAIKNGLDVLGNVPADGVGLNIIAQLNALKSVITAMANAAVQPYVVPAGVKYPNPVGLNIGGRKGDAGAGTDKTQMDIGGGAPGPGAAGAAAPSGSITANLPLIIGGVLGVGVIGYLLMKKKG